MAHHHSNDCFDTESNFIQDSGNNIGGVAECSEDERESRSGGEEIPGSCVLKEKPIYLLEHLATFTVNKASGIVYPADGMRRLLQLEKTTGIWSQKMRLCLDCQWVLIMDYETGNIIERFPATLIQEPTAFTSTDAMELYNNILVFIVSGGSSSRSEMHIFQSQSVSAIDLVDDLKTLQTGKTIPQQREAIQQQHQLQLSTASASHSKLKIQTPSALHNRSEHLLYHSHQPLANQRTSNSGVDQLKKHNSVKSGIVDINHERLGNVSTGSGRYDDTNSEQGGQNDETSSTTNDKYERDVTVLNHCFDDIEKFIVRLQHAAAASRELERRRRNRKTKKRDPGEGLLTLRTRPPQEKEFIDIFAKFKLSFNLLAKLKAHIHDPNAPELVHFLFTPLALIVEASADAYYESQLPVHVVNPLLTREAINLLVNCVTSKETELWRSLGNTWIMPRDQWKANVGSYHPVFLDGWSPTYVVIDELEPDSTTLINVSKIRNNDSQTLETGIDGMDINYNLVGGRGISNEHDGGTLNANYTIHNGHEYNQSVERYVSANKRGATFGTHNGNSKDSIERNGLTDINNPNDAAGGTNKTECFNSITTALKNVHTREARNYGMDGNTPGNLMQSEQSALSSSSIINEGENTSNVDNLHLEDWLENLHTTGAKIVLVTYPRTANNDKELSVVRGEYLEILDDTRKWWKARNICGQVAHVPHTIVTLYDIGDAGRPTFYREQPQSNNSRQLWRTLSDSRT